MAKKSNSDLISVSELPASGTPIDSEVKMNVSKADLVNLISVNAVEKPKKQIEELKRIIQNLNLKLQTIVKEYCEKAKLILKNKLNIQDISRINIGLNLLKNQNYNLEGSYVHQGSSNNVIDITDNYIITTPYRENTTYCIKFFDKDVKDLLERIDNCNKEIEAIEKDISILSNNKYIQAQLDMSIIARHQKGASMVKGITSIIEALVEKISNKKA